ncbi:MAG TPA: glycosyltransferase [Acidimicrobiia bacterium]|nr:glycosyltransferase [Acidimicrobiia bacterium]
MRVLQVHNAYRQAGGEDTVLATERSLLEEAGHQVETHLEHNPDDALGALAGLAGSPWNLRAVGRVRETAEAFRPDVAHIHNTWFRLSPGVLHSLHGSGIPTVITMHNYRLACVNAQLYRDGGPCEDCVGRIPWRGVVRRCYRDSLLQSAAVAGTISFHRGIGTWRSEADVVVALSHFASDRLVRSGVPRHRIVVKENVVADPGPRPTPPSSSGYVLFVGRITEEKGVRDLMSAWQASRRSGLELRMVGSGPLLDDISTSAPGGVEFLGQVSSDDVRELLLSARALVFPSRWYEGQAMILLEALSSGTPIVFPGLGAIPETVGDAGWEFEAAAPEALAKTLLRLADAGEVDHIGEIARARYEGRFAPDVGTRRLEEIYELAMSRHPR